MNNPIEEHLKAANIILRYLKLSPGQGLLFQKTTNRATSVFTDVDWAKLITDKRYLCLGKFGHLEK